MTYIGVCPQPDNGEVEKDGKKGSLYLLIQDFWTPLFEMVNKRQVCR
jgi:hypothetical protein